MLMIEKKLRLKSILALKCVRFFFLFSFSLFTHGCSARTTESVVASGDRSIMNSPANEMRIDSTIPGINLQKAIANLELTERDPSLVSVRMESFPSESLYAGLAAPGKPLSVPLQAKYQIVLQLEPSTTGGQVSSLLKEFNFQAVRTLPELGIIVVQLPRVPTAESSVAVQTLGEIEKLEISTIVNRLQSDSRVLSAAPDTVLSSLMLKSSAVPVRDINPQTDSAEEKQDWGLDDAKIPSVWPRLTSPISIGVVDVGFSEHADLKLKKGLLNPVAPADHGTHVSGIMCAQHNNIGVRGVLKNCTVVYASSQDILRRNDPVEGNDAIAWSSLFSEYIVTVFDFIRTNPDIKVINLSLGYNWLPNFSKDPRAEVGIRNLVKSQGLIYLSLLKYAASMNVALVSAAGNDSTSLKTPLEAKWASPFNFGSNLMMQEEGWSNGLIVEAHDQAGQRADFSNIGGDISCPGVKTLSTIANPHDSLGTMSGTSMASPYCASSLMALRTVLPEISLQTAMRCIRGSRSFIGSVPRLDLQYAIEHCKKTDVDNVSDVRSQVLKRWAGYLAGDPAQASNATTQNGCRYGMRREFLVTNVVNLGDGQGPQFSDPPTLDAVQSYIRSLILNRCTEPIFVIRRLSFGPDVQRSYDFSLGIVAEVSRGKYPGEAVLLEWPSFGNFSNLAPGENRVVVMIGDPDFRKNLKAGT